VKQASKTGEVDIHDLPLPSQQQAEVAYEQFNTNWEAAVKAGNPNLRKVLIRAFGKDLMLAGLWKLLWSVWCVARRVCVVLAGLAAVWRVNCAGVHAPAQLVDMLAARIRTLLAWLFWRHAATTHPRVLCHEHATDASLSCLLPTSPPPHNHHSVITGAFFFIRSLLQFVNNEGWARGNLNGWLLTIFFFADAWLLGALCWAGHGVVSDVRACCACVRWLAQRVSRPAATRPCFCGTSCARQHTLAADLPACCCRPAPRPKHTTGISLQRMGYGCVSVGVRIRAALCSAVCKKCFNMATINKDMASDAVSFMASDISKIFDGCQEIHYLWTAPIEAGAILTILAVLVRVYALPGWGVVFIVLPCQYLFGWMIIKNKIKNAKNTQARGGIIQELLPAMKLVKYYAWCVCCACCCAGWLGGWVAGWLGLLLRACLLCSRVCDAGSTAVHTCPGLRGQHL
jgi:hypothetical protein